jgi:hypothetical protein
MSKPMTMRERMLAVLQGREADRVPFVQYSGMVAPNEEIWKLIGRENMGLVRWSAVHKWDTPNCRWESQPFERSGRRGLRTTLHTPEGALTEEKIFEPVYNSGQPSKHFVKDPADYRALLAFLRDCGIVADGDRYLRDKAIVGSDGLVMVAVDRTPYQQLWVQWVCLEDLVLHMVDEPVLMEEVFAGLFDVQRRIYDTVVSVRRQCNFALVEIPDNITAPVIGPTYFRRFCVSSYRMLAEKMAEFDVPVYVHMDGDLKPLWEDIGRSSVRGLDSLSPPPDNDTSVADVRRMWPEMGVWLNFPSSVHLSRPEVIYETARRILEEDGRSHRLQVQISENVPPGRWQVSFPQIVRAIADFIR